MRLIRSFTAALVAVGMLLGSSTVIPGTASAVGAFDGAASADGFRFGVVIPGAPAADQIVDVGGPSAQARFDSLGSSRAFASFPYPGDVVISAPGLVAGFTGGDVTVPVEYPAYVAADHPQNPENELATPVGYRIAASADAEGSSGTAVAGVDGADVLGTVRSRTSASVVRDGEEVVASAISETDGVQMGPLRLGSVRSLAEARLHQDGEVERSSTLEISGASIDGVPIGLGPDGITFLDTVAPIPGIGEPVDLLAGSGISVVVLEPVESDTGVSSGALQVRWRGEQIPTLGAPDMTLTIGRSSVSLTGSAPPPPFQPSTPATPAAEDSTTGFATESADSGGPWSMPTPSPTPSLPGAESAAEPSVEQATQPIMQTTGPLGFDLTSLYLVVAILGAAGTVAAVLIRIMGVRLLWTS